MIEVSRMDPDDVTENTPEDEVKLVSTEMVRMVRLSVPVETVKSGIVVYVNPAEHKIGYISFT